MSAEPEVRVNAVLSTGEVIDQTLTSREFARMTQPLVQKTLARAATRCVMPSLRSARSTAS